MLLGHPLGSVTLGDQGDIGAQIGLNTSAPIIGSAQIQQCNRLTSVGIAVASPTFSFIGFTRSPDLIVGHPEIEAAVMNIYHERLTAFGIAIARVYFGRPIGSTRDLYAVGIAAGSPAFDVPLAQPGDPITPGILVTAGEDVLYRAASGLEKAMASTDAYRLTATYAELVKDQWDPYAIRYSNLPYLAWAMGVNLWENDWDETFRRWWAANQWELKSQRGSLLGIKRFVQAVGCEVVHAIVPPAKCYPVHSYTAADRAAYVARFPQLRLYPYVARAQLPWLCFCSNFEVGIPGIDEKRVFNKNGCFLGPQLKLYPTSGNAGGRYTRTAVYWDRGIETPLTFRTVVDETSQYGATIFDEVTVPARHNNHYYIDQRGKWPLPKGHVRSQNVHGVFLGALDDTAARIIRVPRDGTLELIQAKAQYQTITVNGSLVNAYPDHVAETHLSSNRKLYGGTRLIKQFLANKYLPPSDAWEFMYELWYIWDPSRAPDYRKAGVYIGKARLGIQRYTAELKIAAYGQWHPWFVYGNGYLSGHLRPADTRVTDKLRRAVTAAMAMRDTVRIDTRVKRVISTNDSLPCDGNFRVGEYINA
jgi:phage tail P2-like protein